MQKVEIVEPAFDAKSYLYWGGMNLLGAAGQFAVILFLVYFFLVTGDLYKRKFVKIAGPTLTQKKLTVQILDEINSQISSFIRVQVFTSAVVAVATTARAVVPRRAAVHHLGPARRDLQLDPVPRTAPRLRRPGDRRLHPVRRRAEDADGRRRGVPHHQRSKGSC